MPIASWSATISRSIRSPFCRCLAPLIGDSGSKAVLAPDGRPGEAMPGSALHPAYDEDHDPFANALNQTDKRRRPTAYDRLHHDDPPWSDGCRQLDHLDAGPSESVP